MKPVLLKALAPLLSNSSNNRLEVLRILWPLLVPAALSDGSEPVALASGVLTVAVATSAIGQELSATSRAIIRNIAHLRHELGDLRIERIQVRNALATPVQERPTLPPRYQPPQPPAPDIADALDRVSDNELRSSLEALMRAAKDRSNRNG